MTTPRRVVLHIDALRLHGAQRLDAAQRRALVAEFAQQLQSQLQAQLAQPASAARLAGLGPLERLRLAVPPATPSPVTPMREAALAPDRSATRGDASWSARAASSLCGGLLR